jgi:hypothetical protein
MESMESPKSENTLFCIRLDRRDLGISFPSVDEAEVVAGGLFVHGYKEIEIVDRFSGIVVKHVVPPTMTQ